MNKLAERLRELRTERKLTLKDVAQVIDMSFMAYSHYERGERDPSVDTIIKLCDFFDVPADYLIGRVDEY